MSKIKDLILWIDEASYEDLLRRWRFAELGDNIFQGEIGQYYSNSMFEKRELLSHEEQVRISKKVGW